jgi:hypothetical protein
MPCRAVADRNRLRDPRLLKIIPAKPSGVQSDRGIRTEFTDSPCWSLSIESHRAARARAWCSAHGFFVIDEPRISALANNQKARGRGIEARSEKRLAQNRCPIGGRQRSKGQAKRATNGSRTHCERPRYRGPTFSFTFSAFPDHSEHHTHPASLTVHHLPLPSRTYLSSSIRVAIPLPGRQPPSHEGDGGRGKNTPVC